MAKSNRYSSREFEAFLARQPRDLRSIVSRLRNFALSVNPNAYERMTAHGLSYHDASRGGPVKAGICKILIKDEHVRLSLVHGAFIPDPSRLLQEESGRKAMRFLEIYPSKAPPWEAIEELIRAQAEFDPATIP